MNLIVGLSATGLAAAFIGTFYVKWVNQGAVGLHRSSNPRQTVTAFSSEITTTGDILSLVQERKDLSGGYRELVTNEGIVNNEGWKTY